MKAKKLLLILLALGVVTAGLTACDNKKEPTVPEQEQIQEQPAEFGEEFISENPEEYQEENEQIANPVTPFDTVEEAVQYVGHLCPLPHIYERYIKDAVVINDTLIQIVYSNDSGEVLTLREQAGSADDISGNYNTYAYENSFLHNDMNINVKGASGDSINLVTWNDGAYAHSLDYINGVSMEEVKDVINEING